MLTKTPQVDSRRASDVAAQVQELLKVYAPECNEIDPVTRKATGLSGALIDVFARFMEILIERLNRAPDKNFLAFLDLLGASLLPPQPARVPLTFFLAPGSTGNARVPVGTQVAAPPGEGESRPVLFETEEELVVSTARVEAIYVRDPRSDRYSDCRAVLEGNSSNGVLAFSGDQQIEHALFIGQDQVFGFKHIQEVRVTLHLADVPLEGLDPRELQWELWDGKQGLLLTPEVDTSQRMTKDGEVVFTNLPSIPRHAVHSCTSRWLRCCLLTPVTALSERQNGMVRLSHLPRIKDIGIAVKIHRQDLYLDAGFAGTLPLDLSKEFFPLGEKPRFGDVFYLAQAEVFSLGGATVTLHVDLTNPSDGNVDAPLPPVNTSGHPCLRWEVWNGQTWVTAGTASADQDVRNRETGFSDTTFAFTRSGQVVLRLPQDPQAVPVNGVENFWIRARLIVGHYGEEVGYEPKDPDKPEKGFVLKPSTLCPPSIRAIRMEYTLEQDGIHPDMLLTQNDFVCDNITPQPEGPHQSFVPFRPTVDTNPSLYLGLTTPEAGVLPQRPLSFFFQVQQDDRLLPARRISHKPERKLSWEYWNGHDWSALAVRDETDGFQHPGLVQWLPPADIHLKTEFGRVAHWVRIRASHTPHPMPRLSRVALNTMMAIQATTIRNEVLGSSNGTEGQRFQARYTPILAGPVLEVRESEPPASDELPIIPGVERAVFPTEPVAYSLPEKSKGTWVRWNQVPDFYGSEPGDRHFVLDHSTGEIRFGNGQQGKIPPADAGNIRLAQYRFGGGHAGNKAPGTIVQLKTALSSVAKVTNFESAQGGADAESVDALQERAPREIRHRGRAVTSEDFEDLARHATPEVARAKCLPRMGIHDDPTAASSQPGVVTVMIVPGAQGPRPIPTLELMARVQEYLDKRRSPALELQVVEPTYVRVDVQIDLVPVSLASAIGLEVLVDRELSRFLLPLTGGHAGTGWEFGQVPQRSDIYARIQALEGVDHIRSLHIEKIEDLPSTGTANCFLVYSGVHTVRLVT